MSDCEQYVTELMQSLDVGLYELLLRYTNLH